MTKMTADTHEQAMACFTCSLSGWTPPEHFPQADGLWDQPCPHCGEMTVWVTEPREREVANRRLADPEREDD